MEEILVAGKYRVPKDRYYTKEHEWCLVEEGGKARIGITDYAQQELGDIVYVELPQLNDEVEQNDTVANIESVKSVASVYSPVSGKIVDINGELENSPELINEYPYEDGWICVIEMKDSSEIEDLMSAEEYAEYLKELVEDEGEPPEDILHEELPE
ncbi:MAG: glycine cleavage system protein GcvH [Gammaproteobacteria bacterium]|nr:MAG: glycine cleavage system protein GcvH [Gammaproteobacteria bacterium]